jgi:hypothetical protein
VPFVELHRPPVDAPDLERELVADQGRPALGLVQERAADALRVSGCVDPDEIEDRPVEDGDADDRPGVGCNRRLVPALSEVPFDVPAGDELLYGLPA